MLKIDLFQDKVVEVMANARIACLIGIKKVERQRLKDQAAVNDITRAGIVMMSLHLIGPDRVQLDPQRHRLPVAQDFELYLVTLKFAFDYFRHFYSFTFELDKRVAGNRVIINGKQDIALLASLSRRTRSYDSADHDTAPIIVYAKVAKRGRISKFAASQAE